MTTLAIDVGADGALPSEFRLFVPGVNETMKGTFLFDSVAAESVMAAYRARANDLAIDLEHQMLDGAPSPDPTAKDARGWCKLELRADGSLWAVSVTWTADGAERLAGRRQRYVSPAFAVDEKTSRVTSILNIAITAIPATHGTPALVAASATSGDDGMTLEEMMKVAEALGLGPDATLDDFLAKIGAMKEPPKPEVEVEPLAAVDPEAKPEEVKAALSAIRTLSGKSFVASVADVRTWHASHVELAAERKVLADREAVLESAERRKLCVEMVTLGGRAPATVWADPASTTPKAYLSSMPIADLRAMHSDAVKASGLPRDIKPPAGEVAHGLTASQLAKATKAKIDPAKYAETLKKMSGKA